ncbi:hypothetical protein ACEYYA_00830 [Paracoccus sp. p3-h83]|uniref:hypothetical protein n=1 Tax=Paracoccus sp. p3-h83 TaxID=3342805 RepID=UPI0035BB73C3
MRPDPAPAPVKRTIALLAIWAVAAAAIEGATDPVALRRAGDLADSLAPDDPARDALRDFAQAASDLRDQPDRLADAGHLLMDAVERAAWPAADRRLADA